MARRNQAQAGVAVRRELMLESAEFVADLSGKGGAVRLSVEPGAVRLSGRCDLGEASAAFDAPGLDSFEASLEAGSLVKILRALTRPDLRLLPEGVFLSGSSRIKLKHDQPSMYSHATETEEVACVKVPAKELAAALRAVRHAMCADETRPHLCGVEVRIGGGSLIATATDGSRLARFEVEHGLEHKFSAVIPRRAIPSTLRMLEAGGDAAAGIGSRHGFVTIERGAEIEMRLRVRSEGEDFPSTDQFFADEIEAMTVARDDLLDAVRRVSLVGDHVAMRVSDGVLALSSETPDGDASEQLDVQAEGMACERTYSARYVAKALESAADGGELRLDPGPDPHSPLRLRDSAGFSAVLMPLRT
jgi:DNA polymerase III sliding clamp (beta) subunit (PCNA family)